MLNVIKNLLTWYKSPRSLQTNTDSNKHVYAQTRGQKNPVQKLKNFDGTNFKREKMNTVTQLNKIINVQ